MEKTYYATSSAVAAASGRHTQVLHPNQSTKRCPVCGGPIGYYWDVIDKVGYGTCGDWAGDCGCRWVVRNKHVYIEIPFFSKYRNSDFYIQGEPTMVPSPAGSLNPILIQKGEFYIMAKKAPITPGTDVVEEVPTVAAGDFTCNVTYLFTDGSEQTDSYTGADKQDVMRNVRRIIRGHGLSINGALEKVVDPKTNVMTLMFDQVAPFPAKAERAPKAAKSDKPKAAKAGRKAKPEADGDLVGAIQALKKGGVTPLDEADEEDDF